MKTKYPTREAWLNKAVELLTPEFGQRKVPTKLRVACGFPSRNALSKKKRRIGEAWADSASDGKFFEIFVSPVLSKPFDVLDTLIHEMVHVTVGLKCGHNGAFKVCATEIGLVGKMTECGAGPALKQRLLKVAKQLGPYPHDRLDKMTNGKPKDVCRLLKAECPKCGYIIRVTRKWAEESGLPICPCGGYFESEQLDNMLLDEDE